MKIIVIENRNEFETESLSLVELSSIKGGFCFKFNNIENPGHDSCGFRVGGSNLCFKKVMCDEYSCTGRV